MTDRDTVRVVLNRYRKNEQLYMEISALVGAAARHVASEYKEAILAALRSGELGLLAVLDRPDAILIDLTS